ncbi:hypothetical protein LWI28_026105 [Acer negundo]|uniref:Alpha-galactosidase n=1 Tax=Acer negundo TaxID=4023 RepID=A0AAD5NVR6_ACENE|nr:hypothetical protein LWI28_026105 [Acer negundo]KAK4849003.1 hypothetical protein QYF36_019630 [Acer negundo]
MLERNGEETLIKRQAALNFSNFAISTPLFGFTSFEKEPTTSDGHCFSKSFNGIFDTSNYGILQLNNGLARTPQMGWNSWNFLACNINKTIIKETADALISTGLANLGYVYVNIGSVGP